MTKTEIPIQTQGTATTIVEMGKNTALAVGSGNLNVFATPMMVALMEEAACNALADFLTDEESTVGTLVHVSHVSPTPVGDTVTATATVTAVEKRKIIFYLTAKDGHHTIGTGTHERFVINAKSFMEKLAQR